MSRTKKIEALTAAQEAQLLADRAEWLAIGRSCLPAERAAATEVFVQMYTALGKPTPVVWWWDGPATAALARTLLTNTKANLGANLGTNLWDNLWANLRANLGTNLWDNLGANLRANLRANLGANLGTNLWANLGANLRANLRANLEANLRANLRANLEANLWANLGANLRANLAFHFWGQHEASWSVFYWWADARLRPMHTDEQRQRIGWWLTVARSVGWWEPYEGVVMACERPERQAVDAEGRLHHETEAAFRCRDGWEFYAWHGVRVPEKVIRHPETLTGDEILNEENAEVRRVMVERTGYERFLGITGAQRMQADDYGELFRITLRDDEPIVLVRVLNSTPEPDGSVKPYLLRVPPQIERARDAVAWTFDVPSAEYAPSQQT